MESIKKLQTEISYLDIKIERNTILLITGNYINEEERLLQKYISKMLARKIESQKLLEIYTQEK